MKGRSFHASNGLRGKVTRRSTSFLSSESWWNGLQEREYVFLELDSGLLVEVCREVGSNDWFMEGVYG